MPSDAGSIVTVDGRIDPSDLGVTLPHEHMFADASNWLTPPESAYERKLADEPVSLENRGYIQHNLYGSRDNMRLDSYDEALEEIIRFKRAGGDAVVDLTPKNVGRDPRRVRGIAREAGLHYVHGTGYYVRTAQPDYLDDMTGEEIEAEFVSDVREGIGDTTVRAGIVGELGVSGRIHEVEERVVRAGARAAARTGAAMNIHTPGRTPHSQKDRTYPPSRWALDLLDICEEEGLPADRVVMSHLDRTFYEDLEYQREVAERGAYVEYDLWGLEAYIKEYDDGLPSDVRRAEWAAELIEDGYTDRLLFSQDVWGKIQRVNYGGYGYAHILENVWPILRGQGVSRDAFETITVENPRRVLTFEAAD
jgi:phosphotriesterase-related protein